MACDLTKDGRYRVKTLSEEFTQYTFVDFGDLGTVTLTNDEVTDISAELSRLINTWLKATALSSRLSIQAVRMVLPSSLRR
jgi:hypothetical protein